MKNDEYFMRVCIGEAMKAYEMDEVPIGAIIVKDGKVISRAYNQKTLKNVAIYHAEVLAIEKACLKLKTWYLDDCILYTTVEPCLMCTGAIQQARIGKVVYGAKNQDFGYLSHMKHHKIEVVGNVLDGECSNILTNFFKGKRN